ncbi:dihydroxyacetone kinase subunit DhaL [Pacificibacter marinus]|uniref:PTS-dependent dihydroxyacetone kinase, ADP-binding subunit DhaL n=1 Tax=Pacificibacter marinus TaxID=658057 RepID=A0A1Y5T7R7_9RHOB|nr:dihydroxyacetone kinase subunit DhaL [Pacificibacter marinus]SEL07925.1 dihydroxyacetone kinase DhaL subunit [Pacificibacter marinus]SLN57510.1 PTS-dependent dihydroxyacetone kinase, ADP-binding subunit DhaL [Pacificibacter marinus]
MQSISNTGAGVIIQDIAAVIVENKAHLSEIDGKIGDGDHGVNMAKGFGRAADRLDPLGTLTDALGVLSDVLMGEIGGSMGPLYGMTFADMADDLGTTETIDAVAFASMIRAGLEGVQDIGAAKVGDKTMIDTFVPAVDAFDAAISQGKSFSEALAAMKIAAEIGRDSTVDLVAKLGRAARLGERSRGTLDAGAVSCCIILSTFADSITARLS